MRRITLLCLLFFACYGWQGHGQIEIGPQSGTTSNLPIHGLYDFSYSQQIVYQNEISATGDITSLSVYFSSGSNPSVSNDWTIYLGHTGKTGFTSTTDWIAAADLTQVFTGAVTFPATGNWMTVTFDTPFLYNGSDNLVIAVQENQSGWSSLSFGKTADTAGSNRSIYYSQDGTPINPGSLPTAKSRYDYINNMILGGIQQSCPVPSDLTATNLTISTADLGWTEAGSATTWDIEWGPTGFVPAGIPTIAGVTTNPYQVSVSPNTTYDFYVRADCGGGDVSGWAGPYSFTTPCTTFMAPWTEDFSNGGSIPNCWNQGGANSEDWVFDTTGGHVGDSGDFMGTNSGSGGHFAYVDDSSPDSMGTTLITPNVDVTGLTTPTLSFYTISNNEGNSNVSFSVDFFDGSSWNTGVYTSNSNTAGWIKVYIDLSSYTITGPVKARFIVDEDNASGDFYDDRAIDDVSFDELPTCQQPTDLTAANFTTTSADLGWTEAGAATMWDIEVVEAGTTPSGTPTEEDVTSNPYNYGNLTPSTDYEFYVRADCGSGDTSYWTGPHAFSTECDIVTTPFTQGFETTDEDEVTTCWSIINQGGSDAWYVNDVGADAYDGTKVMYISWDSSPGHDDYLITPQMLITAGSTDRFTFHASSASTFYQEVFNVLVSTTGTDVADFSLIEGPINAAQTGYSEHIYDLSAYAGQNIYIAIQVISDNQLHMYVDGVVLDAFPSCLKPTALTAANVTAYGADFGWTESGTATTWDIEVVEAGTTPTGNPTYPSVTTNPYTVSDLDPATDYEFYVRADCGGGDLSEWSQAFAFTTLCATFTPDYTENFDTFLPNCWEEAGDGTPATGPSNFGTSSWSADEFLNTGSNMAVNINLYFTGKEEWLISPNIDLSGGATELSYMVAATDYNNSDPIEAADGGTMGSDDEVQVLISEDDGVTWTNLMTYNAANTPSHTGDLETIDLSAYTGTVKIAFWATEGTVDDDPDYDFFVDDFAITATGGGGPITGNCAQMQVSNNFENGYGMDEGGGFVVAHDFIVSASTTNFSVENITGNFLVNGGIASMDVIFYADNGGLPGAQIGTTIEDIVPTSQTVIGSAFGFDVYEVSLDLPTPVDFAGSGTGDDVSYWLQLVAVPTVSAPVYWEVTTIGVIGESGAFSAASPIAWEHDATNPDGVFTISGVCTYVSCPAPIDLMATATSATSVDITWTEIGTATEWIVEYGAPGFTPGSGTVINDNDGTLGVSISGLTAGTQYEYYVTAVCGSGQSFAAGPVSFNTPVCDPSSQCDYTFTLTDAFGDGWNGAQMEVRQNGIAIATLQLSDGATMDVSVPICDGIDFELYWTVPGAWDGEVGISITNPFGIPIFTMDPGTVTAPASVYIGTGDCTAPSCQQPLNLAVTNIGSDTADLSWDVVTDATNGYVWYVFDDGADPTTATPVSTGSVGAGVTTAQATGLTPISPYDFYVEADCDANGMSDLSGPISFQTAVAPPICGGNFYDNGGPAGNYDLNANNTTTITPITSGDVVTVTFTAFEVEAGWDVLYVYDGPDATYPLIDSGNPATNGGFPAGGYYGTSIPGPFTSSDPSGALTFVFMSDGSVAQAGWVADVTCGLPIACPAPTDLIVNGIGEDSATVSWTPEGSETEWEVEYGETGFTPGTGAGIIVPVTTTPSTLLSGLDIETTYDVYVTAICDTENSMQVGPTTFSTLGPNGCAFSNPGNAFENGSSNSGDIARIVANDIIVPADQNFSLENIVFQEFMSPGVTATTVDVYIYIDNSGAPGTLITTIPGVVPTSQSVIGNNFGYDASQITLDITPFDLNGQAGADTIYWIGLSVFTSDGSNCFWENTTASIVGAGQAYNDGTGAGYTVDSTLDGVYSFNGSCTDLGINEQVFEDFSFYPNPVKDMLSLKASSQIQQVEVFNLLGQSVMKTKPNSMTPTLQLSDLQAGAYVMKVTINGAEGVYRLIKE